MSTLRVASYNTRDLLDDRAAAARVVRAVDPDVLCLQEVPRRLLATTRVAGLAAECGLYWPGRHRGSGGTTIFTSLRVQVTGAAHRRLPVATPRRTRGYAVSTVVRPGHRPLVVASVHLSLDPAERVRHVAQVLAALPTFAPVLLAGDLNEGPDGDAWRLVESRLTRVSPGEPTFPARRPSRLIDAVFASPSVLVLPHRPVDLDEADVLAGSDHRPVWVDVEPEPL
ncbi:MAG TPA: endonuclease/exonuclease/phosphatase family protein [Dermatophilaceae bacterium]|nr:endonuclease/exonuclease/phosphatase family protein [Dermatophilaceae bacterium]